MGNAKVFDSDIRFQGQNIYSGFIPGKIEVLEKRNRIENFTTYIKLGVAQWSMYQIWERDPLLK